MDVYLEGLLLLQAYSQLNVIFRLSCGMRQREALKPPQQVVWRRWWTWQPVVQHRSQSHFPANSGHPADSNDNQVSGHQALEGAADFRPYFNPDAFRLVRDFEIGDVGSTLPDTRGPGYQQWDLSLLKDFTLGKEGSILQFRAEVQNFTNRSSSRPV